MLTEIEDDLEFVCYDCIGDAYLKAEVKAGGKCQLCAVCGNRQHSVAFDSLCERVHQIVSEEFERTASEPDNWALYKESDYDWEREGDQIDEILYEILECDERLIAAVKERLSDLYFSFDEAAAGEENPYGDEAQYKQRKPNDRELWSAWSRFEDEIRTQARFFSRTAESFLDGIFGEIGRFGTQKRALIRDVGPGTPTQFMFRARRAFGTPEIARIVERPARELGAPPSRSARNGRMNPRWISMLYGAFDAETCVAEIRAPVGSSVVIGKFEIVRPLRLLDLGAFRHIFVQQASFFDPGFRGLRDKAYFLKHLVSMMSRPVMPSDEDFQYLPTQAIAEYLSEKIEPRLDGSIFPSSQRGGTGENVVLFRRAATVEPDDTDNMELETDFGRVSEDDEDLDITVRIKKPSDDPVRANPRSWDDLTEAPEQTEEPALRIDLDAIEVRYIRAVEYRTEARVVRRYRDSKDETPF
jgi:RES domain/HEPN/RES N-terminal domain 1